MSFTGFNGPFTFTSRFEYGSEANPEELAGAAIAGCYSMSLSALISKFDLSPNIETSAVVSLGKDERGPNITNTKLSCNVTCEGLSQEKFTELAQTAKEKYPISRLYAGGTAMIELTANLS
jgi:osmotically inducible protein OsmC